MDRSRPRVLYLGGTGRSGSTLLARLLGRRAACAPVGELRYVWERGFVENHLCECGEPFRACPFWNAVVDDAFGGFTSIDIATLRNDLRAVDRIRHIPELLAARWQTPAFRTHLTDSAGALEQLYAAITTVSGRSVVVDSSKDASYAFVLHALGSLDLALVHLVRDSRAVAHSWTRRKIRPEIQARRELMMQRAPMSSALLWDAHNLLFELFEQTDRRFVRVRYEDLVARPEHTVDTVAALHGDAGENADASANAGDWGHSISGNPMRFTRGPLQVRLDDEWIGAMAARDRRLVTAATAPFLARYGYLTRTP